NGRAYAYIVSWRSLKDVKFLAELLQKKIKVRSTETSFEAGGRKFAAGSLVITKAGNHDANFDAEVRAVAAECHVELMPLSSGFVDKGADIGSRSMRFMQAPKIMLITGEGTSAEAMGEIWF